MIKFVKLVSGEDVVADLEELPDGKVRLTKPIQLQRRQSGVGMCPLAPTKSTEITIRADHIVFACDPEDQLTNAYCKATGVGLVRPTPQEVAKLQL